ncbi:alpha/beta fold hydrolase [Paenibacillus sp. FSL L8-0436]|uniref:alpha/beta fold hydrolase n=1 Tax=Paenibacillus sp. FSL L8-0436 TaxID=2954686 RepID=UPI0031584478
MAYISRDDIDIHYEYNTAKNTSDRTETLVLIHGLGFDLRSWDFMVPYMTDNYHIVRYDLRGHGLSGSSKTTLDKLAALFVENLRMLLDDLQIQTFHIIAHGAGSIIALYFAKAYPDRVRSTVLLSLPLFNSSGTANKYKDYRKKLMTYQSMLALADHVIPNATLYPRHSAETEALYSAFAKVTFDVYLELLDFFAYAHNEIMDLFKQHTHPTLMLTGEQDPMYPPYLSSLIAYANPNCRFMTLYNASNMVFYDQPEETFKQIEVFLKSKWINRAPLDPLLLNLHSEFLDMVNNNPAGNAPSIQLKINLLNRFTVAVDDIPIISGWGRRSAKDLLIYLLLNPVVTRDRLCEELWRDMDLVKARGQLRVCLTHLKQLLNNEVTKLIYSDKQQISLQTAVDSDVLTLLAEINRANKETNPELKEPLIHSVFAQIQPDLFRNLNQEWNLHLRVKMEIQLVTLAQQQSDYLASQGKFTAAIAFLKYVLLFNAEEFDAYEQIANLYEQNHQKHEAKKWRLKAEQLQQTKSM